MKLYRSLIYREMKLTRKGFILIAILLILLAFLFLVPFMLGANEEQSDEVINIILLFVGIIAVTGGVAAGTNNGLQKADINSGWKKYSFVLPYTAKQQALTALIVKFIRIAVFGLLTVLFSAALGMLTNKSILMPAMSSFFISTAIITLVDAAYCFIILMSKDKRDLKKLGIIASVAIFAVFEIIGNFAGKLFQNDGEKVNTDNVKIITTKLFSETFFIIALSVFAAVCLFYFLAMWKSYERREP